MLYKYRKLHWGDEGFVEQVICKRSLWLSPASQLNDKLDCYPEVTIPDSNAERIRMLMEIFEQRSFGENLSSYLEEMLADDAKLFRSEADLTAQEIRQKIGVLSLSRRPDILKCWKRYADTGNGVCLGFEDGSDDIPFFAHALPVVYAVERPNYLWSTERCEQNERLALLQKTLKWSDEEEERIVDTSRVGLVEYPRDALKEVIFGWRCQPFFRLRVVNWIKDSGHDVKLFVASRTGSRITVEPIDD